MATRILVVDSDPQRLRFVARALREAGYDADAVATAAQASMYARCRVPDAAIVEVELPDATGIDVCTELREWSSLPVILLGGNADAADVCAGLDAGADDFVRAPVGIVELLARVRAVLRRADSFVERETVVGGLSLDLVSGALQVDGARVRLTPIQFRILRTLARHPGKLLTHRAICEDVWGPRYHGTANLLHVHIWHLRKKIELDPSRPRRLITEHGLGFRLLGEPAPAPALSAA
jgi:two-component system, OmpR family, KDP operon response regulator KdpE